MPVKSPYRLALISCLVLFLQAPLFAGVVFEVETTDHSSQTPKAESWEIAAEGKNLKMEVRAGEEGPDDTAIFRGDRREMVVVDHSEKSYMVMDKEMISSVGTQVSSAMAQVQEALKNVPEDQRAMVEKMMKERMPSGMDQKPERPKAQVKKTGERAEMQGYPCVRYDVLYDGAKLRELWVTDWSNIEGGQGAAQAFQDLGAFFEEMMDAFGGMGGGLPLDSGGNFFESLKDLDGFPVVVREFEGEELESESLLKSATMRDLDPDAFEPPKGYRLRSMGPGF